MQQWIYWWRLLCLPRQLKRQLWVEWQEMQGLRLLLEYRSRMPLMQCPIELQG